MVTFDRGIQTVVLLALLTGCGSGPEATEPPRQIAGGWNLTASMAEPKALGAEAVQRTRYSGPQDMEAIFYRFSSATSAFEAMQKYRKQPGEISFQRGPFLVVVNTRGVPPQAAGDFVEGVNTAIR